jgi:hypothetical protein
VRAEIKAAYVPPTLEEQLIKDAKSYSLSAFTVEHAALIRAILARWPEDVGKNADILRKYWCAPMNKSVDEKYFELVAALNATDVAQCHSGLSPQHPEQNPVEAATPVAICEQKWTEVPFGFTADEHSRLGAAIVCEGMDGHERVLAEIMAERQGKRAGVAELCV